MDWLLNNKNRVELERLQEKRATLIIDVTINRQYRNTYQWELSAINKQIEIIYKEGM